MVKMKKGMRKCDSTKNKKKDKGCEAVMDQAWISHDQRYHKASTKEAKGRAVPILQRETELVK